MMILIGPEDIGKQVIVKAIGKIGIVTNYTDEYIWVMGTKDIRPQRYAREFCQYAKQNLFH